MAVRRSAARQALGLAGWLAACFVTGGIGAIASVRAASFYAQLVRPGWAPPAWLFAPMWSTLYVLMAIAAWLVWRAADDRGARDALTLFVVQLFANALWTWLFFVWHLGAIALIEIGVLWMLIAATLVLFWRIRRLAALLLVPYLAWVTLATALTFAVWRRNPSVLG